jgi:hypothetical protein
MKAMKNCPDFKCEAPTPFYRIDNEASYEEAKHENTINPGLMYITCRIEDEISNATIRAVNGADITVTGCKVLVEAGANVNAQFMNKIRVNGGFVTSHNDNELWVLDECYIRALNNSKIWAWYGCIMAQGDTHVIARTNAIVKAYGHATIEAFDNSYVSVNNYAVKVRAHDHAIIRSVHDNENIVCEEPFFGHIHSQKAIANTDLIVYKSLLDGTLATLRIPKGTRLQSQFGHKCRAERAFVVSIETNEGSPCDSGMSRHNCEFIYKVGEEVIPDNYDTSLEECSNGIHFFLRKEDAKEY